MKELIRKHLLAGSVGMEYELWEVYQLLDVAKVLMQKKNTLIEVRKPVNVCGDLHGQYGDLMRIFNVSLKIEIREENQRGDKLGYVIGLLIFEQFFDYEFELKTDLRL